MPILETIATWNSARRVSRFMHRIQKKYQGCEVIDTSLSWDNVAVIVKMEWNESVYNPIECCDGDWVVAIRYLHNGYQTWTSTNVLELTGNHYADVDAAKPLNPLCQSVWS